MHRICISIRPGQVCKSTTAENSRRLPLHYRPDESIRQRSCIDHHSNPAIPDILQRTFCPASTLPLSGAPTATPTPRPSSTWRLFSPRPSAQLLKLRPPWPSQMPNPLRNMSTGPPQNHRGLHTPCVDADVRSSPSSYESLPPNFSLAQNMVAGAFAGIAVWSMLPLFHDGN